MVFLSMRNAYSIDAFCAGPPGLRFLFAVPRLESRGYYQNPLRGIAKGDEYLEKNKTILGLIML